MLLVLLAGFLCDLSGGRWYGEQSRQNSIRSVRSDTDRSRQNSVLSVRNDMDSQRSSSTLVPNIDQITNFIAKLCNEAKMEYECIVILLIYVRRVISSGEGTFVLLSENWRGIVLACVVISNKVWDDFHMKNEDYCQLFRGLTIDRVNDLELQLFKVLDHRFNVSPSVYAQTHFEIQDLITSMAVEKGRPKKQKERFQSISKIHMIDEAINVSQSQSQLEIEQASQHSGIDTLAPKKIWMAGDSCNTITAKIEKGKIIRSVKDRLTSAPKIHLMQSDEKASCNLHDASSEMTSSLSLITDLPGDDDVNHKKTTPENVDPLTKSIVTQFVAFCTSMFNTKKQQS